MVRRGDYTGANFEYAHCDHATFNSCHFVGATFGSADCQSAHFLGGWWKRSHFESAKCQNASFLGFQDPSGANFRKADCKGTLFQGCALPSAEFVAAILDGATFDGCELTGADFSQASLRGATLSGSEGLTVEQMRSAKTIYHAKLDPDLANQLRKELETPPPEDE
jgi:uncharacterized protein YjbI with pentapeptide repeats